MPLIVQPAQETDLKEAVDVYCSAFASTSVVHKLMYPNGDTESVKASIFKSHQETFQNPLATCFKVVDTENNNRIAAWIDWKTWEHDQPESEWVPSKHSSLEETKEQEQINPDINVDFVSIFFGSFDSFKSDYIKGKARIHIRLLTTHKDYFRRGCGKLLLDKCSRHADKLHLPTTLEASPFAVQLYLRHGFERVKNAVIDVDLKPYGVDEVTQSVLMRRRTVDGGDGGIS